MLHWPTAQSPSPTLLEYVITAGFLVCSQFIKCSFSVYSAAGVIDSLPSENPRKSQLSSLALTLGWWEMASCAYAGSCFLNLSCHRILTIEWGCFLTCPQHILLIYVKNWPHDFNVLLSHNILVSAKEIRSILKFPKAVSVNWVRNSIYLCFLLLATHCFPLLNCGICGLHKVYFYLVFCLWLYPRLYKNFLKQLYVTKMPLKMLKSFLSWFWIVAIVSWSFLPRKKRKLRTIVFIYPTYP